MGGKRGTGGRERGRGGNSDVAKRGSGSSNLSVVPPPTLSQLHMAFAYIN